MESAETISASGQEKALPGPPFPPKSRFRMAVLPDAVGPKRRRTGIAASRAGRGEGTGLLFFYTEFHFPGKNLAGREGNHLAVIVVDLRVPQHGKLVGPPGSGGSDPIHIVIMFNEFFQGKYHSISIYRLREKM
jgi:hypothetical protein